MEEHYQVEVSYLKGQVDTLAKGVSDLAELKETVNKCHGMLN